MTISIAGTQSVKAKRKRKNSTQVETGEIVNTLLILMLLAIPLGVAFGASLWRVKITSETQNLMKQANNMQADINAYEREIKNYNIRIEKSCGRNIISKVKDMKMDLNYPKPGQIKRLNSPAEPKIQVESAAVKKQVSLN